MRHLTTLAVTALLLTLTTTLTTTATADQYVVDPAHTSFYFKIGHANIADVYGRFNDVQGDFATGENPHFNLKVATNSIDTGNQKRDEHLRSPDFFNAVQFPVITFESTQVTPTEQGYDVTGDLTIHGVTNSVTVPVVAGGTAEFPEGTHRAGFGAEITINRSDYDMTNMLDIVGDEVTLLISFEGVRE